MTDTPQTRTPSEGMPKPKKSGVDNPDNTHDQTPAGERSPREDMTKTPGDGTLQDATPAGMSSKELRERAEDTDGSTQPGTG
ncbi:hypothetical protein J2848_003070 [Azospirillum lipoferum]|uniref:Uncharacterized protein n=1 Tax=Azospirillum lipoferum TaxID=193 RepID=A0A5A9GQ62_AZOLI|nr:MULTISPECIES: hypothetical protein [Azospirillum]KAA0595734.1 hypothetical protein FZ942_15175 [Azospirillum lipoferum]MCP1611397.1 hypothetical protein [Azospirillum lipoferum]MDW5537200.1 hypothetical protein [Azospirillum sp. NL1]